MDNFVDELTRHYQKRNHLASTTYCDNKVVQIYSFKINYLQTYQKITLELSKIFSYSHLYNEPVDNFVDKIMINGISDCRNGLPRPKFPLTLLV